MPKPNSANPLERRFDRVLVVEDNDVLARVLARTVSCWARSVVVSRTLLQAQAALTTPLDLVIADVRLPDGSSHQIFDGALRLQPPPLLVAISGKANALEAYRLGVLGVQAFVPKPFSAPELQGAVLEALGRCETGSAEFPSYGRRVVVEAELDSFAKEHDLTKRQAQIVRLAVLGTPRERLAIALGVSENTCKTVVRRLLAKCGTEHLDGVVKMLLTRAMVASQGRASP